METTKTGLGFKIWGAILFALPTITCIAYYIIMATVIADSKQSEIDLGALVALILAIYMLIPSAVVYLASAIVNAIGNKKYPNKLSFILFILSIVLLIVFAVAFFAMLAFGWN